MFETWAQWLNRTFPTLASGCRHIRKGRQIPRRKAGTNSATLQAELLESRIVPAGTWTNLAAIGPAFNGGQAMMLLSDGTAMIQVGGNSTTKGWYKLTPTATGNYVTGSTLTPLASMAEGRLFFTTAMLPDGRVFAVGGEYSTPADFTNSDEIYDPVANTWTTKAPVPTPDSMYGDDPIEVLPDGQILAGYYASGLTYRYNPVTNAWVTTTGSKMRNDASDEESWVKLPDTSILSYDVFGSDAAGKFKAQRYIPSTDTWVDASTLDGTNPPAVLSSNNEGFELGPAFLLPDGRAFYFGATNGKTAYYDPATNIWTAGAPEPIQGGVQLAATDNPGAVLPNGNILIALSPLGSNSGAGYNFPPGTFIYEYNPVSQTYTNVTPPGIAGVNAFELSMLLLPTGQVLMGDQASGTYQVYTEDPNTGPQNAWRPTITNVSDNFNGTFTLAGTQLNGLSEGSAYGDDEEMASNYPIVRFSDGSANVFYGRTTNWSSTGVATGATPETTLFTLPAGHVLGDFKTITVIANGIESLPYNLGGTTSISKDASGNLVIQDVATGGKNDNLTIQADVANSQYIIFDPTVTSSANTTARLFFGNNLAGASISPDKHTAFVPFADVTGPSIKFVTVAGNDRVTIDDSLGNFTKTITVDGGAGNNTLRGPDRTNAWNITATNAGNITGLVTSFTNVQNLIGGALNDTFKFNDNVKVTGAIDGKGGTNTANFSLYAAIHSVIVNLASTFANIQIFIGGAGSDTFIGANTTSSWGITSANAGNVNGLVTFSSFENLTGGAAQDVFTFNTGTSIKGNLNGGSGNNSLIGPNLVETWSITASNKGKLSGVVPFFQNIQNLTGGSALDAFVFANGAIESGKIDGGGGSNWLNYQAFTKSLTINLNTGANTAAGGGVSHIANLIGSANGGDHLTGSAGGGVLVGHGANNVLTGGAGSSLLIGGYGKNVLFGGSTNDILINGYTAYDKSITSLQNILTTWKKSTYAAGVAALRTGPHRLQVGTTVFLYPPKYTTGPRFGRGSVLYETLLVGNVGQDWYFSSTLSSIYDRKSGELVD